MNRAERRGAGRVKPKPARPSRPAEPTLLDWYPADVEHGYWRIVGDAGPYADTWLPDATVVEIVEARAAAGRAPFEELPRPLGF